MKTVILSCSLAGMSVLAPPVTAHHSPAMFDLSGDVTFEGAVTEFDWRNPHVYIELEIVSADGERVLQRVEAGPASNLVAQGMAGDSIRPGDHVVIEAKPNRAGEGRTALGWMLTTADGAMIPLHVRAIMPSSAGVAEAAGIAGTWVPQGTGFASLARAARGWPLTERGRAAVEETREARIAARSECVPYGPPALMMLPSTTIVEVGDAEVTFTLDVMDTQRVVHLDQREHPAGLEPSLHGHSIGHWEGVTLVVDTVGYAPQPDGFAFDLPSSASKHVVERFTLSADRKHLDYSAVVEDPEYLATTVSQGAQWDYRPVQEPSNLPCDPEVAGRFATD